MEKSKFESLDSCLFEPISHSLLKQIRGGDHTNINMPTYNTKCNCTINDGYSTEDNKKKKPTRV